MNLDTLAARVGDVTDPSPEALLAGRHRLDAAIRAADHRVVAIRRSRRPRRRVITALAGAAAAAAALLAVPVLTAGPASAEAVLLLAADAAAQQPDEAAGAAYWHVTSELYHEGNTGRREIWQGRTAETVARHLDLTDPDHVPAVVGDGQPATFSVGGHGLSWADLDALPTDAGELGPYLRAMVKNHPAGEDNELWEDATGLLMESPASPALRRALWQVVASIPDVTLLGTMTDAVGRQGTGIERNELAQHWYRIVFILDPTDGTLLEKKEFDADGTVVSRYTFLDQGPSDTAPQADPPICGPGSLSGESC